MIGIKEQDCTIGMVVRMKPNGSIHIITGWYNHWRHGLILTESEGRSLLANFGEIIAK